jgi:hypothetical protein
VQQDFVLWKRKRKSIGNGMFVYHRIVSAVKKEMDVGTWTGSIWLRIRTGGGHL